MEYASQGLGEFEIGYRVRRGEIVVTGNTGMEREPNEGGRGIVHVNPAPILLAIPDATSESHAKKG
jgi:hypothetical protein